MNKAFFFDRDGVVNLSISNKPYIKEWNDFIFNDGIFELIKHLKKLNYFIFLVTNQQGIAKSIMTVADLNKLHEKMQNELTKKAFPFDEITYCPHFNDNSCKCRKPNSALISHLCRNWNIEIKDSYLIGDQKTDIQLGKKNLLKTIILNKYKNFNSDFNVQTLKKCINLIKY